jgi:hypothetical protein
MSGLYIITTEGDIYFFNKLKLFFYPSVVERDATRGATALVYYCIHSSLYTRTVQGC